MPAITPYEAVDGLLALASVLWTVGTLLTLREADRAREARNAQRPPMAVSHLTRGGRK